LFSVTGYRLQVTGYRLQVTGYRLQVTGYRLQVTGYNLLKERPQYFSPTPTMMHENTLKYFTTLCVTKKLTRLQNGITEYAVFLGISIKARRWRVIFLNGSLGFFICL